MVVAGSKQQQAMAAGCVMFSGRRREGEKIKREEVGRLGQNKWAARGIGLDLIEEMAAEFVERTGCSGKTNGPIKVEDFRPDSKLVLFCFKKILFISITNLVYPT
jgi:hypothetical protein